MTFTLLFGLGFIQSTLELYLAAICCDYCDFSELIPLLHFRLRLEKQEFAFYLKSALYIRCQLGLTLNLESSVFQLTTVHVSFYKYLIGS